MADSKEKLTQLGAEVPVPASPDEAKLECVTNPHIDTHYLARFTCPEFTSICPVTGQPDVGSVLIRYSGPKIDETGLLRYLVSYRQHNAFHEACVERIFMDIRDTCETERLTVYARYNRRGGLDINPCRSDFEPGAENLRLWRQ